MLCLGATLGKEDKDMDDKSPMLELRGVSHVYVGRKGASLAVDRMELAVGHGEFISLVGPSGCGKTTVLSLLAGLFPPAAGQVLLGGKPVTGPSAKVGYMLQQDCLLPWRTIRDNAGLGLDIAGRRAAAERNRVEMLLEEVGLAGTEGKYPGELSGGMRQRVALARTLAPEPMCCCSTSRSRLWICISRCSLRISCRR
ncbi:hypothetical protein BN871_IK_00150, partial [Paenibacillus sp. P22]